MTPSVRGRLITAAFARDVLPDLPGATVAPPSFHRAIRVWSERCEAAVGPASSARALADVVVAPLLDLLGHVTVARTDHADTSVLQTARFTVVVAGWNELLGRFWRSGVLGAIAADTRWCLCCNGRELRIVDAHRTWAREHLEFSLLHLSSDAEARGLLWTVACAGAFANDEPLLDRAVDLSARYGVEVCAALGAGVLDGLRVLFEALASSRRAWRSPEVLFEHSLTILYRVVFLLFAEARSLVPMWHPVYRDRYSLDGIVTTLLSGRPYRGLWQAVTAISRLAHSGCSAGELKVTAFNGRLFAPPSAGAFDEVAIDDAVMGRAVVAVTTTTLRSRRTPVRINYRDLDVEQLGAVYEHVLAYEPAVGERIPHLERTGDVRKSTGTFYTPKLLSARLVRQVLEPLVRDRSADDILKLRVLDPAMGSGAFLVAAGRYLASAAEEALVREGRWVAGEITPADRIDLRREVALRCLFGVDLNPVAVQLARVSMWLATLAADRPLSFLDHHLVAGDSLIGATPEDLRRQPTRARQGHRARSAPSLFDDTGLSRTLEQAVRVRAQLTEDPDSSASVVRTKEQRLASLLAPGTALDRWSRALDLWCSGWFWTDGAAPDRATFHALCDSILGRGSPLPDHVAAPLLGQADEIARRRRFVHFLLRFPEVFVDERGEASPNPGFDAVIGNPPWDMVRGDSGQDGTRDERRREARRVLDFVRESGVYRVQTHAHLNRYQLFVERALQLVRSGGRVGLVLPAGAVTDGGAAGLRRHLFDRARVDTILGLDNRAGIFPIHRSVRFVLLSGTYGYPTSAIACRFGIKSAGDLGAEPPGGHPPLIVTRQFLARLSGEDDLGVPELAAEIDRRIVERLSASAPWLGSETGWRVRFGRELNATDDRGDFEPYSGRSRARPVIEGKQVDPFRVSFEACRFEVAETARSVARVTRRARLAYRDIASATNRLTLIAAIIPPAAVTTHTVLCLKTPSPAAEQRVLCALLNSFVANYLVRLRVNTHVTVALVQRLPVPVVRIGHPRFAHLSSLAASVMASTEPVESMREYAELQALAARLYGLTALEFEHVLSTFPLIPSETKTRTLSCFNLGHGPA